MLLEDAVGRHRIAGDLEAEAEWLPSLALASAYAGDPEGAATAAQSALERASDDAGRAAALDALALADYAQKQWVQAIEHAELSIALCEKVGIADGAGYTENFLGIAKFRIGDRDGARRALEKASEIGAQIGNPRLEGFAEFNLARVLDEQSARTYALRARTLLDSSSGDSRQAAEALVAALDPSADSVSRQQALGRCSAAASQVPDLLA